jgi:hypothetical protein
MIPYVKFHYADGSHSPPKMGRMQKLKQRLSQGLGKLGKTDTEYRERNTLA